MLVIAVLSFFLSPFIVHKLGNNAYGAWILLSSVVGYLGLLDLGVRSAVTKYVATLHAVGRHDKANHIASAALALFSGAGIAAIAMAFGFAEFGLGFFDVSPDLLGAARLVLRLGGVTVAMALVGGVFGGIVVARQRFDLLNLMTLTHEFVRFGAIFLALWSGGGLVELAVIQFATGASQMLITFFMSRRIYPEMRPWKFDFKMEHVRMVLTFGFYRGLSAKATWLRAEFT
jgi:O-antigen/teichoic acid export membrane protein